MVKFFSMEDCLFCKIAQKKIPSEVVYEDENSLAFLDINPHAPGHTMVIPKRHAETLFELKEEDLGGLMAAVKKVAQALKKSLISDGFTIGINHGKASGQAVEHLHIHILPRFLGDGGSSIHGVVMNPPKESLSDIGARIRSKMETTADSN